MYATRFFGAFPPYAFEQVRHDLGPHGDQLMHRVELEQLWGPEVEADRFRPFQFAEGESILWASASDLT